MRFGGRRELRVRISSRPGWARQLSMSRDYAPRPGGVYYNRNGDGSGDGGMDQMHHQMQMHQLLLQQQHDHLSRLQHQHASLMYQHQYQVGPNGYELTDGEASPSGGQTHPHATLPSVTAGVPAPPSAADSGRRDESCRRQQHSSSQQKHQQHKQPQTMHQPPASSLPSGRCGASAHLKPSREADSLGAGGLGAAPLPAPAMLSADMAASSGLLSEHAILRPPSAVVTGRMGSGVEDGDEGARADDVMGGVVMGGVPGSMRLVPGGGALSEVLDEAGAPQAASGIIFGCTSSTFDECFALSMVGLPRKYLPLVKSIVGGYTLIFLFNFSDRQLHGVYLATSDGQENLSLTAWRNSAPQPKFNGADGEIDASDADGSPFPAQCTFNIVEEFAAVPEAEFRHILEYTERQRFKFKLSRWQCRDLLETLCMYDAKQRARRLFDELQLS